MLSNQSNMQPMQKTCPHSVNLEPSSGVVLPNQGGLIRTGRVPHSHRTDLARKFFLDLIDSLGALERRRWAGVGEFDAREYYLPLFLSSAHKRPFRVLSPSSQYKIRARGPRAGHWWRTFFSFSISRSFWNNRALWSGSWVGGGFPRFARVLFGGGWRSSSSSEEISMSGDGQLH
jgi:hypothetical protein